MMKSLATSKPAAAPVEYGEWWNRNDKGLEWYEEIYQDRRTMHEAFQAWITRKRAEGERLDSFLEIGCGRAVGYSDFLRDYRYVGYDISEKEIEWCRVHRPNPLHTYISGDFINRAIDERFDLVFSHAVIDHVYDIDALLSALVKASRRWLYVNSYRGWFPELKAHVYNWSPEHSCFYNDLSPARIRRRLLWEGCSSIEIFPLATEKQAIPHETVIIAKIEAGRWKRWGRRALSLLR